MSRYSVFKVMLVWFVTISACGNAVHAEPPVSGEKTPGVELLDTVMLKYLKKLGCSGATLTVARGEQTLYSRGYGWIDLYQEMPIAPDTPMCIASCDKPFTAAAIRQLALDGKLDLNASVLKLLQIKPAGKVVDKRVWDITINHLLEHKAGWQGEPFEQAWVAANGRTFPFESDNLLRFVMTQKLAWKPGEKSQYDSFGYNTLKVVVARISGQSYVDYLRHSLCTTCGVNELIWVRHGERQKGEPPQLWNGLIMEDPEPYRMSVSTPALCIFMRCFWINGRPRDNGNPTWYMYGSWDNSTSMMLWRSDGINVAFVFNGRGDAAKHEDVQRELDLAIDRLKHDKRLPGPRSAPNLLVNGSFEYGTAVGGFLSLNKGSTAIRGWTVTRGQIDYIESHWPAADGKRSLDLHGSPGYGGVAQTFKTNKGQHYRVTFALAGTPQCAVPIKKVAVSAAGKSQAFAFDTTGGTYTSLGWVTKSWEFEAVADATTLEIYTLEKSDPVMGPAIDDVQVRALSANR